jgi:hypothetical protein
MIINERHGEGCGNVSVALSGFVGGKRVNLAEYIREMFEHEKYRVLHVPHSSSGGFDSFAGSLGLRGLKRKLFAHAMAGEYPRSSRCRRLLIFLT